MVEGIPCEHVNDGSRPQHDRDFGNVNFSSTLEQLPLEILEHITWLSYNPNLPYVSRSLMARLSKPYHLRRDMMVHVFNGWEAAHARPELLRFLTPCSKYAESISSDHRQDLQQLIFAQSWCTLNIFKATAADVMRIWISSNWNLEDKFPVWTYEFGTLDEVLTFLHQEPFRHEVGFFNDARNRVLHINHGFVNVKSASRFFDLEGSDADSSGGNALCRSHSFKGVHVIITAKKVHRLLVPPCTNRVDSPIAYDLWVLKFCDWYTMLEHCYPYPDGHAEAWRPELVMSCLETALKNQTASVFKHCLDAYYAALPKPDFHSFHTLHDGFVLRLKDSCVRLARWGFLLEILLRLHTQSTMPRKWFSDDQVEAILRAGHFTSKDDHVLELARHLRTHAVRPTCEQCLGR